ncbi:hypothetical protein M422DRAFT_24559 [Sphaerobolus stellatus SS14]|nr:hypothetical protein M422DRAFT_24559 [Sphaerobolus stellatus SS14]
MEAGTSQMVTPTQAPISNVEEKKAEKKSKKELKEERRKSKAKEHVPGGIKPWEWKSLTDSGASNRPPIFTPDCRYFFLIAGSSVKIYSTTTGQVVSTLSSSGSGSGSSSGVGEAHTEDITAAVINPRNAYQLYTASLDGRIKTWDYLEAVLLSTFDIGEPITHMCLHESLPDYLFVSTNHDKRKRKELDTSEKESSKVYRVSLKAKKGTEKQAIKLPKEMQKIGKMRRTIAMGISPSGEWLVAIGGTKAYVCSTTSPNSGFIKFVSNEMLTCLAFHPTEDYFATGDNIGQIRLWYCLDPALMESASEGLERRAKTTTMHWHAHPVSSLSFSGNGAYLLSGGEEAVLVIWQLHSGKREFVPRVGAPISTISVASHQTSDEEYLLVLSDATIVFISSATFRIARSFARVKHDPKFWSSGPAPLAFHTLTSTVILPSSHPSSLLAYSPSTSTLISEIEVSPSNRVSRKEEKSLDPSRVEKAVISPDGLWLATIDGREPDGDFEREAYLKIWQWDVPSSTWNLNSRIDRPHGIHKVTALLFAAAAGYPYLVSTGEDGNVKVWRVRTVSGKKGEKEVFWVCRSTQGYRSQVPHCAACSPDGSLLAIAFGSTVAVYELSTNAQRLTLKTPETRNISNVIFIGGSGRFIAVSYWRGLVVWDLITGSVRWQGALPGSVYQIVSHPKDDTFVVTYYGQDSPAVRKFGVLNPTPLGSASLPFRLRNALWYPLAGTGPQYTLIGITQDWNTVLLGDRVTIPEDEGAIARSISKDTGPQGRNLFQDIFGVSSLDVSLTTPQAAPEGIREDPSSIILKSSKVLNVPHYLLPPLQTLYSPLVEGLVRLRPKGSPSAVEEPEAEPEELEDEDVIMGDAETTTVTEATRSFSEEEMNDFIDLFRDQTFSIVVKPTPSHKLANGNGVSKVAANGTHHYRNGSSHISSTPKNGKALPQVRSVSTTKVTQSVDSSPPVVGKKRKKSMG